MSISDKFPILFPNDLGENFSELAKRNFMSHSYFSSLIMGIAILPAKLLHFNKKHQPLIKDQKGFCEKASWIKRSKRATWQYDEKYTEGQHTAYLEYIYNSMTKDYSFTPTTISNLETLEVTAKQQKPVNEQRYEIYCGGNGAECMDMQLINSHISNSIVQKNFIFWNYPDVAGSVGKSYLPEHLYSAGLEQAMALISKGIPAKNIRIHGHSLGGSIAIHVAKRLAKKGHFVELEIDRSFSKISAVIPASIAAGKTRPLKTIFANMIGFAVSGLALGISFAGLLASLDLLIASSIAPLGYIVAYCIKFPGFILEQLIINFGKILATALSLISKDLANEINRFFKILAEYLASPFNFLAYGISLLAPLINASLNLVTSLISGGIGIAGIITGSLIGLAFGTLAAIQHLWTNTPVIFPIEMAFSAGLNAACLEMDSVAELQELASLANQKNEVLAATIVNTLNDKVIVPEASLAEGIGISPGKSASQKLVSSAVIGFWYKKGNHCKTPKDLIASDFEFDFGI